MASAKKKPSAKRTVKYGTKAQSKTARPAARAAHAATTATKDWAQAQSANWQKGANEWAKQSAKLYQFPGAENAAASMQSATENMMKMGSEMMQQMFGQAKKAAFNSDAFSTGNMFRNAPQMPGFDASEAQERVSNFARESAEQLSKSSTNTQRAMHEAAALGRENMQVLMDVANIATTVSKEMGAEYVNYLNKLFSQNVELSKQVLTCRTLNDMFDLSSRMLKTNLDGFFTESVKMSEMLFQCATDVSEPLNERMSETTERMTKVMAA